MHLKSSALKDQKIFIHNQSLLNQTSDFERQLKEDKLDNNKWQKFDKVNKDNY